MQHQKLKKKILLTNAGTTVAQNVIDYNLENIVAIYAVDVNPFCYAAKVLKRHFFIVPSLRRWAAYKSALLKICYRHKIDLIIPCSNDEELLKFSAYRCDFEREGIKILVANQKVVKLCDDKYECNKFIASLGIKVPKFFLPAQLPVRPRFPLFLKNRYGGGSARLQKINDQNDLSYFRKKYEKNIIFQQFVKGTEYSVDLVVDNNFDLVAGSCRKRVAVKSGICIKTEMVKNHRLMEWSAKIIKKIGLSGPVNLQFINDYFIEVNPRLPGGLGLVSAAGFNMSFLAIKSFFGLPITDQEKKYAKIKVLRIWKDIICD